MVKHGHARDSGTSRTYNSWRGMLNRVKGHSGSEKWYKGILVCERWYNFGDFLRDMGIRPEGKTLDRIDSAGDYTPDNCRWATCTEQTTNRRDREGGIGAANAPWLPWAMNYAGVSARQIADYFGCTPEAVYNCISGKSYAWRGV